MSISHPVHIINYLLPCYVLYTVNACHAHKHPSMHTHAHKHPCAPTHLPSLFHLNRAPSPSPPPPPCRLLCPHPTPRCCCSTLFRGLPSTAARSRPPPPYSSLHWDPSCWSRRPRKCVWFVGASIHMCAVLPGWSYMPGWSHMRPCPKA